jgi:hypothetical protein
MVNANNFVIWIPGRDGHAPPFWQDGMLWCLREDYPKLYDNRGYGIWEENTEYCVSPEAVTGPPIDDTRNDAKPRAIYLLPGEKVFDVQAWLAEGHANADKLPAGVVLPEPTDWAMQVAEKWCYHPDERLPDLAKLIRTHCRPREVSNG